MQPTCLDTASTTCLNSADGKTLNMRTRKSCQRQNFKHNARRSTRLGWKLPRLRRPSWLTDADKLFANSLQMRSKLDHCPCQGTELMRLSSSLRSWESLIATLKVFQELTCFLWVHWNVQSWLRKLFRAQSQTKRVILLSWCQYSLT